jgi:hypothetical protein
MLQAKITTNTLHNIKTFREKDIKKSRFMKRKLIIRIVLSLYLYGHVKKEEED